MKNGAKKLSQKFILEGIQKDLESKASSEKKKKEERFFKEKVNFIGCLFGDMREIERKYMKMMKSDGWAYNDFLETAEELLKHGTFEETTIAFSVMENLVSEFRKSDFDIFERWLSLYVSNWAHCDHISPHIVGELVGRYPELANQVFEWAKSKNRWMRRAAAVTYVIHGRKGKFHEHIFKTAEALVCDEDEMVQKGAGWMLKTTSEADESAVAKFLLKWKNKAPRLVLRYATEKMSAKNRELVLK